MNSKELKTLLLILLLAFGLRIAGITFDSLWLDESYQTFVETMGESLPNFTNLSNSAFLFRFAKAQPIHQVLVNFRQVDPLCPPLYAILLNRWIALFGQSDLAVRMLSVVFSLLSLIAIYFFTRTIFSSNKATFALIVAAISPFDIYYAQEARMYSLETLAAILSCASLYFLCRVLWAKNNVGMKARQLLSYNMRVYTTIVIYAGSTWALINTHYTTLFVVVMQIIFAIWLCLRHKNKRLFFGLCLSWLLLFLFWLPWCAMFQQAAALQNASFYITRANTWWWPVWAALVRIPFNWITFLSGKQVVAYAAPIYFTSSLFLILAIITYQKTRDSDYRVNLAWYFLWSWAILPPLIVWFFDILECHRLVEISRYVMATAPAIYILAGYGIASAKTIYKSTYKIILALFLVHVIFALGNNAYAHMVAQREPWRQMAALVESNIQPDEPLLVSQYYNIVCLDRYLTHVRRQFGASPSLGSDHIRKIIAGQKQFWLLTAQEGEAIKNMIPANYYVIKQFDLRHGLHLRHYRQMQN